jgi:hypothetical protein
VLAGQISRIACVPTTGATFHTDLDSLRFLPPLSTITTERGGAASTLPRMGGRPGRVATAIWPSTKPLLVSKTRYTLRLILSENSELGFSFARNAAA